MTCPAMGLAMGTWERLSPGEAEKFSHGVGTFSVARPYKLCDTEVSRFRRLAPGKTRSGPGGGVTTARPVSAGRAVCRGRRSAGKGAWRWACTVPRRPGRLFQKEVIQ